MEIASLVKLHGLLPEHQHQNATQDISLQLGPTNVLKVNPVLSEWDLRQALLSTEMPIGISKTFVRNCGRKLPGVAESLLRLLSLRRKASGCLREVEREREVFPLTVETL